MKQYIWHLWCPEHWKFWDVDKHGRCPECGFQTNSPKSKNLIFKTGVSVEHENGNGYRTFPTGATRDTGIGKLEISRYTHPAVFKRFATYMHGKQNMPDGTYRKGDNWQKGMPEEELLASLMRHITDIWLHLQGWGEDAEESLQTACCGVLFNASAILLAELKREKQPGAGKGASWPTNGQTETQKNSSGFTPSATAEPNWQNGSESLKDKSEDASIG